MYNLKRISGCIILLAFFSANIFAQKKTIKLFNEHNFNGWEGDTVKTWRIQDGVIIGGYFDKIVPENNFLVTTKKFSNFNLKLKFKLIGKEGFVNTGVQFHSVRLTDPPNEMKGYQADLGDGYWGSLYDESRRNKTLTPMDTVLLKRILKRNEWNDYEVRSNNGHITIFLNGHKTADYVESDKAIPQSGLIGLQIHGGGKAEVYYKDIVIKEL
ncbi:MAG: DUF1080 domain-containing protein [Chitinophagaceae bacterium]|nr:DUF1080 domain-containing protein [Chitinophagaceae bacterium]